MDIKNDFLDYVLGKDISCNFTKEYFENQYLHIKRNDAKYFKDILNEVFEYLDQETLRYPDIRFVQNGNHLKKEEFTSSFSYNNQFEFNDIVNHSRANYLMQSGSSLVATHLQRSNAFFKKRISQLNEFFGGECLANLYITPPENQGYKKHFDKHDVLVLQLFGSKKWSIFNSVGPTIAENKNYKSHIEKCDSVPTAEILLEEGDVLYLPKGFFHDVKNAGDKTSIHISIGIEVVTWRLAIQAYLNLINDDLFSKAFLPNKNNFKLESSKILTKLSDKNLTSEMEEIFNRKIKKESIRDFLMLITR